MAAPTVGGLRPGLATYAPNMVSGGGEFVREVLTREAIRGADGRSRALAWAGASY